MKMIYNGTPVKSLNVHHFEMNTNDCDMVASDLQAGKTAVARGQKITGTGKSFEFAMYGSMSVNFPTPLPSLINIIEIACMDYPVQLSVGLKDMKDLDFSNVQSIANVVIDGEIHPITVQIISNMMTVYCSKTFDIQVFYGKDNYV